MLRRLVSLLSLCLAFASVDAATDVGGLGTCGDLSHEIHGERQTHAATLVAAEQEPGAKGGSAGGREAPATEHADHFCHCAVHAPTLPPTISFAAAPVAEPEPALPARDCATRADPPPRKPPKHL